MCYDDDDDDNDSRYIILYFTDDSFSPNQHIFHTIFIIYFFLFSAPPLSIQIQGYEQNSKVEVRENQDLTLTCIVADAKPAAQIEWIRGKEEYKPGK